MSEEQRLPNKEASLFKTVLKEYERKRYKLSIRASNKILAKFPDHGETLAMKGLCLHFLDRKDEALTLVQSGVRNDPRSHVVWHVYGLLFRAMRKYEDAIKCYRVALKIDDDNNRILRDLATLQIQCRDIAGYVQTRNSLLAVRSTDKANWMGLVVGHHMEGNLAMALSILDTYKDTAGDSEDAFDRSELLLYRSMLLEEMDDPATALAYLDSIENDIRDVLYWRESRARLLLALGRDEAVDAYRTLLAINTENKDYHKGLAAAMGVPDLSNATAEQAAALSAVYRELAEASPRSYTVKRMQLDFTRGDEFKTVLTDVLKPKLRKGVPSLFSDLKSLLGDSERAAVLKATVDGYAENLRGSPPVFEAGDEAEPPSSLVWVLLFAAQLYHETEGADAALAYLTEAKSHTPTLLDVYSAEARVWQSVGAFQQAAYAMEYARTMDLADRYVNTESTKLLCRADRPKQAAATVHLFTKDTEMYNSIHDMQCMWFETAMGESYARRGESALALKMFHFISDHMDLMLDDQFDFHAYCLRRSTYRAYVESLRVADRLKGTAFFRGAARGAIAVYLDLHDNPRDGEDGGDDDAELEGLSEAEVRKVLAKRKKAAKRAAEAARAEAAKLEEEKRKEKAAAKGKSTRRKLRKEDPDPEGVELFKKAVDDPLRGAMGFLEPLLVHAWEDVATHVLAVELYVRKRKYVLAARSVIALAADHGDHPETHRMIVMLLVSFTAFGESCSPPVRAAVRAALDKITGGATDPAAYNDSYLSAHTDSVPHRAAVAKSMVLINEGTLGAAAALVSDLSHSGATLEVCTDVLEWLVGTCGRESAEVTTFSSNARALFPHADAFRESAWEWPQYDLDILADDGSSSAGA